MPDGTGDAPSIQAAITSAVSGDTVLVHPGTYYESLDFLGKNLVVLGSGGASETILDGSQTEAPLVTFQNDETQDAVLEGFTIRLARSTAILCRAGDPVIRNNLIVNNLSARELDNADAGGMYIGSSSSPLVEGNLFEANECTRNGGCLSLFAESPIIRNNVFRQNRSAYDGGAILLGDISGQCLIEHNEFWGNVGGDHGGAMEIGNYSGQVLIRDNLFVDNVAKGNDLSSDSGTGGGLSMRGCQNISVENNTFVSSTGINWAPCTGGAILLDHATSCHIVRNIFAGSQGCGIACYATGYSGDFRDNLFWQSVPQDIANDCPVTLGGPNLYANPLFCAPETGDYRVAHQSPALAGGLIIGAFPDPACSIDIAIRPTTWGLLKSKFTSR
jgi:parallel beta helix pectate lyase-like protein